MRSGGAKRITAKYQTLIRSFPEPFGAGLWNIVGTARRGWGELRVLSLKMGFAR